MNTPQDMPHGCNHPSNTFGNMTVLTYTNANRVLVRFDATGAQVLARADNIRKGRVKDPLAPNVCGVGFVGQGPHPTMINGERTQAHRKWTDMIVRCYSEDALSRYPTYRGCRVCREWHNFQNFAEWYEKTYPHGASEPHQLDKDIAVPGNKLYHPSRCLWVTPAANASDAATRRTMSTARHERQRGAK